MPPLSVSPAAMLRGRSTSAEPSFSIMSIAACSRPMTIVGGEKRPSRMLNTGPYCCVQFSKKRYALYYRFSFRKRLLEGRNVQGRRQLVA